jgi:TonB family protein
MKKLIEFHGLENMQLESNNSGKQVKKKQTVRTFRSLTLVFIALIMFQNICAQSLEDAAIEIGSFYGQQLNNLAQSRAELKQWGAELNDDIETARQNFWTTYPDKDNHQEAKKRFGDLLYQKDMILLEYALMGFSSTKSKTGEFQSHAERVNTSIAVIASVLGTGIIDGGIYESSFLDFTRWVMKVNNEIGKATEDNFFNLFSQAVKQKVMDSSKEEYRKYREMRDIAEYDAAGVPLPVEKTLSGYVMALFRRTRYVESWPDAAKEYQELAKSMGEGLINKVALEIKNASKTKGGLIADLSELGLVAPVRDYDNRNPVPPGLIPCGSRRPFDAFIGLLSNESIKAYYVYIYAVEYRTMMSVYEGDHLTMSEYAKSYDNMCTLYGIDVVENAILAIKNARKHDVGHGLYAPTEIGVKSPILRIAFEELLNKDSRSLARRILMAPSEEPLKTYFRSADFNTRIHLADSVYNELKTQYSEEILLNAANKCYDLGEAAYRTFFAMVQNDSERSGLTGDDEAKNEYGVEPTEQTADEVCDKVLFIAEEMPEFEGGEEGLRESVRIKYPEELIGTGQQGRVLVSMVVGPDGQVMDVKISRGVNKIFDQLALERVRRLRFLKGGRSNGEPVCVSYTIPVSFKE